MSEAKKLWSDERIAAALNKVDTNWFRETTLYKAFGWLEAMRDEYEEQNKKMLTPDDIANYLAVTPQTVTNLIREGDLPGIKIGKQWRVDPDQFQRYLQHGGTPTYRKYVDLMAQEQLTGYGETPLEAVA